MHVFSSCTYYLPSGVTYPPLPNTKHENTFHRMYKYILRYTDTCYNNSTYPGYQVYLPWAPGPGTRTAVVRRKVGLHQVLYYPYYSTPLRSHVQVTLQNHVGFSILFNTGCS